MRFHPAEFGDASSMRGKLTAYERRHGEEYTGLDLPLGCRVTYRRPEPALKEKHKFDTPTRNGVFVGWDIQPGGVWRGGYIVADEEDLFNGVERLVTVMELRDPDEIAFPFQGAHLKDAWPVEADESGSGAKKEKKRRISSRPDYIDSKSWFQLQYPTRLKIAEDERMRKEREAGGDAASSIGGDVSGGGAEASHTHHGDDKDASADPGAEEILASFRASAGQPVIIEFCCAPDSQVGKVEKVQLRGGDQFSPHVVSFVSPRKSAI